MSSTFSIDSALKLQNLESDSLLRLAKQNLLLKIGETKFNDPRLTQKQATKQMGFSCGTLKRYRIDIIIK